MSVWKQFYFSKDFFKKKYNKNFNSVLNSLLSYSDEKCISSIHFYFHPIKLQQWKKKTKQNKISSKNVSLFLGGEFCKLIQRKVVIYSINFFFFKVFQLHQF